MTTPAHHAVSIPILRKSVLNKKARRHPISPDTSSHPRQAKIGELKSKINSNLNNKIISKPVNSEDLIFLIKIKYLFWIIGLIIYLASTRSKKLLLQKNSKNTE
jgi:hypothetical protein